MADDATVRANYLDELEKVRKPHKDKSLEYEKLAIDYTTHVFKTLTYLYGGSLIALPAAVALFGIKASDYRISLLVCALCFVLAIILVCLSNAFAFFTMARRAEAEDYYSNEQQLLMGSAHYPSIVDPIQARHDAQTNRTMAISKYRKSDQYRCAGIWMMWISLVAFVGGCISGSLALMG